LDGNFAKQSRKATRTLATTSGLGRAAILALDVVRERLSIGIGNVHTKGLRRFFGSVLIFLERRLHQLIRGTRASTQVRLKGIVCILLKIIRKTSDL
jgi:hypothetical protein